MQIFFNLKIFNFIIINQGENKLQFQLDIIATQYFFIIFSTFQGFETQK